MDEVVSRQDLKAFEDKYVEEASKGKVSPSTQFNYAWCLIRTANKIEIKKGVILLQGLCHSGTDQRDYLYFLAEGNYKLGEYDIALKYVLRVLQIEPGNRQAQALKERIEKQKQKDGLIGLGILSGASLFVGGAAVLLGLAFASRK